MLDDATIDQNWSDWIVKTMTMVIYEFFDLLKRVFTELRIILIMLNFVNTFCTYAYIIEVNSILSWEYKHAFALFNSERTQSV